MKNCLYFLLCSLFSFSSGLAQITISEIMFDPAGSEYYDEFVEIYNNDSTKTIDLTGWQISDGTGSDQIISVSGGNILIGPNQFALILDAGYFDNSTSYDSLIPPGTLLLTTNDASLGSNGFSNSQPEKITLLDSSGDVVSSYQYSLDNSSGSSDEKINLMGSNTDDNWSNSRSMHGTPGFQNSVTPTDADLSIIKQDVFYVPTQPQAGKMLTIHCLIRNSGLIPAGSFSVSCYYDLNNNSQAEINELIDDIKTSESTLLPGDSLAINFIWQHIPAGFNTIIIEIDFEADQNLANNRILIQIPIGSQASGIIINEIMSQPTSGQPEWIELFNHGENPQNLHQWRISDERSTAGTVFADSNFWLASQGYVVVASDSLLLEKFPELAGKILVPAVGFPTLNNSGDAVVVKELTGWIADSVYYLENWGGITGVSLERVSGSGASNDPQNWQTSQASEGATPGKKNSVHPAEFDLALKKIVTINPTNPAGGELVTFSISIINQGLQAASQFELSLFHDVNKDSAPESAEKIATVSSLTDILPGAEYLAQVTWEQIPAGRLSLIALVEFPQDEKTANNRLDFKVEVNYRAATVLITEIMFYPWPDSVEWIEIYNPTDESIDLQDWGISDSRPFAAVPISAEACILPARDFIVLTSDSSVFQQYPQHQSKIVVTEKSISKLNNSGDAVCLFDFTGFMIDTVFYSKEMGYSQGFSLERISLENSGIESNNWAVSQNPAGATPAQMNSYWPQNYDLAVTATDILIHPEQPRFPISLTISFLVRNKGLLPIDSFELTIFNDLNLNQKIEATEIIGSSISGSALVPDESIRLEIDWDAPFSGKFTIGALVQTAVDGRQSNNLAFRDIGVGFKENSVIINEFLAKPGNNQSEWIELFNPTSDTLDLDGWSLFDAVPTHQMLIDQSDQPGLHFQISGGGYAILASDSSFFNQYPTVDCPVLVSKDFPSLNDTEDAIILKDLVGFKVDSLWYSVDLADEIGKSLERVYWKYDPNLPQSWLFSSADAGATPGADNSVRIHALDLKIDSQLVVISPEIPNYNDSVNVAFTIQNVGKQSITGFQVEFWNNLAGDSLQGEPILTFDLDISYEALEISERLRLSTRIPPSPSGHRWLIIKLNLLNDLEPLNNLLFFPFKVGNPAGEIVINEILYSINTGQNEWIEVYNRSDHQIDIGEWSLADANSSPAPILPTSFFIPSKGYAVITNDSSFYDFWPDVKASVLFTSKKFPALGNEDDRVWLLDLAQNRIDSVFYNADWGGEQGISLERINPDISSQDSSNWNSCVHPKGGTPGKSNSIFVALLPTDVSLAATPNPFSPDNDGFEDFTAIRFKLPLATARVNLKIFDAKGRLIRTLLNNGDTGSEYSLFWDGLDNYNQKARMGIYIVYLEALNEQAGVISQKTCTVVLANKL